MVRNECFIRLLALFVEDAKIVPDLRLEGVQASGLDDVLERVRVVTILVVHDSESSPVSCFARVFESSLLEEFKSFLEVILCHKAPSLDIESVSLTRLKLFNLSAVVKGFLNVAFLEAAPSKMLIDLEIVLVSDDGSFILVHCLVEVFLLLI